MVGRESPPNTPLRGGAVFNWPSPTNTPLGASVHHEDRESLGLLAWGQLRLTPGLAGQRACTLSRGPPRRRRETESLAGLFSTALVLRTA